jgi:chromosome segregation ATPase
MSVQRKSSSPSVDSDLETTAELPVLDVAAYEAAAGENLSNTDTWIALAPKPQELAESVRPGVAPTGTDDKRSQLEVSLHALSDNLREVEERLQRKGERLAEIEQALAHAQAERTAVEQHSKQLTIDLNQARTAVAAGEDRIAELQRNLEEREASNRELRAHDKEFEEKLALRDKALALVQQDLTEAQARAATYMETLQSTEGRRSVFEDLSSTLHLELDERDERLARLGGQLSAAAAHARELESELRDRMARITKLEKEVSELGATVAQREEKLSEAKRASDELRQSTGELGATLTMRDERIRTLESIVTQHSTALLEREAQLDELAAGRATLTATVASLEAKLAEVTARGAELDTTVHEAQSRCEELETAIAGQRKRSEQLESELATVRAELQQRITALQEASTERSENMARIAAGEVRAQELEDRIAEQQEFVRVLQVDSNASVARVKELEGDLGAAEDMINRLETDLRGRSARLAELEKTNQEWRATVEEARHALTDRDSFIRRLEEETANSAVLLGAIRQRLEATGNHELAPEGDKRLLIRSEDSSEVVHVLGRKTTVGRTPDNDLQIDAKFISRHHAVILAGPVHTIIEDLNSTNGVLVNGRRITRQILKDGDAVVIGKTVFRFAVRPAAERRT